MLIAEREIELFETKELSLEQVNRLIGPGTDYAERQAAGHVYLLWGGVKLQNVCARVLSTWAQVSPTKDAIQIVASIEPLGEYGRTLEVNLDRGQKPVCDYRRQRPSLTNPGASLFLEEIISWTIVGFGPRAFL